MRVPRSRGRLARPASTALCSALQQSPRVQVVMGTKQSDAKGIEPSTAVHPVTVIGGSGSSAPENTNQHVAVLAAESAHGTAVTLTLL